MRRILLFILLAVGPLGACNKFLETEPEDFVTPEDYYNTESDLRRALNGVYNRLIDQYGRMYSRGLYSYLAISDEFYFRNVTINNIKVMEFDAGQLDVGRFWETAYQGIDRANLLLENINKPKMDEAKRNVIKGETLFLRAYYYFLLVDHFGGVPLKLTPTKSPTDSYLPRSTVKEVYTQIVKDMREAEGMVSDINGYTYNETVTQTAVQAMMARVFLTMAGEPLKETERYADALTYADKVINSGRHSLNPDYKQIFINHSQDKYDLQECIWEVGMFGNQLGNAQLAGGVGIDNGVECADDKIGYSTGGMRTTERMFKLYTATDPRREWAIAPYKYTTASGVTTKTNYTATQIYDRTVGKWRREYETATPKSRSYNSTNFPVIRFADVLLMKAEAENALNGPTASAYSALNMVRRRGYGKPLTTPDVTADAPAGMDKITFLAYLQDERARELAFEGIRKHDLIRWGLYLSKMQTLATEITATAPSGFKYAANAAKNVTARNLVFPIPNSEITVNHLITQNPNW